MCCGKAATIGPIVVQDPTNPLPALPPDTPITSTLVLLRYIGTTAAVDLAGVPSHARYRLRADKTVTVNAMDVPYLMAKVDDNDANVFERLS